LVFENLGICLYYTTYILETIFQATTMAEIFDLEWLIICPKLNSLNEMQPERKPTAFTKIIFPNHHTFPKNYQY